MKEARTKERRKRKCEFFKLFGKTLRIFMIEFGCYHVSMHLGAE